jgi:hypothetical protein
MVVERSRPGVGWLRHVERMESRVCLNGLDDCWFLDSAVEYPLVYLNATIFPELPNPDGSQNIASDLPVFNSGMIGSYIRFRTGLGVIISYTNTKLVTVRVLQEFPTLQLGSLPIYANPGEWSCTPPISVLNNLHHLEGLSVGVLADGGVVGPLQVTNGSVTLDAPASRIVCGLQYISQLGTLFLDVGDPNAQGRRKSVPAVTLRLEASRGLYAGPDLNTLYEMKLEPNEFWGLGSHLITGDVRMVLGSWFNGNGQTFIQQYYPLPATILGIIPEVWVGDTP